MSIEYIDYGRKSQHSSCRRDSKIHVSFKVDVAFSFDTTGSMYACLGEVRRKLQETISRLKRDIPGIRLATIAHGDYCDAGDSYVTKARGDDWIENLKFNSQIYRVTIQVVSNLP